MAMNYEIHIPTCALAPAARAPRVTRAREAGERDFDLGGGFQHSTLTALRFNSPMEYGVST